MNKSAWECFDPFLDHSIMLFDLCGYIQDFDVLANQGQDIVVLDTIDEGSGKYLFEPGMILTVEAVVMGINTLMYRVTSPITGQKFDLDGYEFRPLAEKDGVQTVTYRTLKLATN
jgi:hypothetical protein